MLPPAEHLQAEPQESRAYAGYFWTGALVGAFAVLFWVAVAFGTGVAVVVGGR